MRLLGGAAVLALSLLAGHLARAQEPSEPPGLQLCLAAAADSSPVYPTQVFPFPTRDVAAVFRLGKGERYAKLTAAWTVVEVGTATAPGPEIARSELPLQGKDRGVLRLAGLSQPLPVGSYRLDVEADGRPWRSVTFTVAAGQTAPRVERPEDLVPLDPGTEWTYALVQEAAEGVQIDLPGVRRDPDGARRALVTLTVVGTDAAGSRVETRVNTALVLEEWWRPGPSGFTATQRRRPGSAVTALQPPQVWLPFPLGAPQAWTYEARDRSVRQTSRMWGPLPVATPQGHAPGYIVLTEERTAFSIVTVERHFVPAVGLVREVIVKMLDRERLNRQELVLQEIHPGIHRPGPPLGAPASP